MTANMCRNNLKSASKRLNTSYDELDREPAGYVFNMEEQTMYDSINNLSDTYRSVLYLHYYEGYTFKEIARMLHMSTSAVSMRVSRGREELKKILSDT